MLSYESGKQLILENVQPLEIENRPLSQSRGFALAKDITASHPLPLFNNSAVDGYAVRSKDLEQSSGSARTRLKNLGYLYAGVPELIELGQGCCVQIATGAPVPDSADAVVMKEDVELDGDEVIFKQPIAPQENVRFQGEDIAEGKMMLPSGIEIGSAQLALLATFGHAQVPVFRKPSVSIISTGNELVDVDRQPEPGQIRESNRFMLEGLVREAGCHVDRVLMVPDDPLKLKAEFEAAMDSDVILISGGMSVGDHDFAKPLLKELGVEEIFWKISVKPGKPLFFGKLEKSLIFGLPGNPASSYVIFMEFTLPALRRMRGCRLLEKDWVEARLSDAVPPGISRLHLMRGQLNAQGKEYRVRPLPFQGSHSISSLVEANALIWIDPHSPAMPAGTPVKVRPLDNEIVMEPF